jgi:predicted Zn-dependent protease
MPEPNAVAVPGGGVGVTQGLLDRVQTETGLAMVLAHELGHHQHRHALKRIGRGLIFTIALGLILGGDVASVAQIGLDVAETSYSRGQETESDEFGLRRLFQTYGTTEGCLEFFEMMQKEFETDSQRWMAFFSTHPLTSERIAHLRELAGELEKR